MDREVSRRQFLAGTAGGLTILGAGKTTYNVVLGFDRFTGTNLTRQDLDPLVADRLAPTSTRISTPTGYDIVPDTDADGGVERLVLADDDSSVADVALDDETDAARIDREFGLEDGPLEQLVADLSAFEAGRLHFEYHNYPDFFDTLESLEVRPYSADAFRGPRRADPDVVETFSGADPADVPAMTEGLVDGFREHTRYDIPRYLAGSVEENVIFGRRDLRGHFESETSFEAMMAGEDTGLFCGEMTRRSVEAFQAVPAVAQSHPVFAGFVNNRRHKHVFTILSSIVRDDDGDLLAPVTFLDYRDSTLYDDLRIRWLRGDGLDAYDTRHRATYIGWYH